MAKQIIWSLRAQKDRTKILKYWLNRNKSNDYSTKLNELFKEAAKLIAIYPKLGRPTDQPNVRLKVVRDNILFYEEINNQIFILTIWDSRQSPEKLEKLMKK